MSRINAYTKEREKLAALVEQEKTVSKRLQGFAQEQQAVQANIKHATEQAAALRGKVMRGNASDEDMAGASAESDILLAKAKLDELRSDENICRVELSKLQIELSAARTALSRELEKLCSDMARQRGESLTRDRKLRDQLVDIYATHCGAADRSLGAALGGSVSWEMLLEELFPMPTDAEFEAAYARFKSQLR